MLPLQRLSTWAPISGERQRAAQAGTPERPAAASAYANPGQLSSQAEKRDEAG